jgi:serine/threonine protein kinase
MNLISSAIGQGRSWSLLQKLGEGDAGEVFLVESLLDHRQAILKRPSKSAFTSDIIRQATQIANEGKILAAFNGLHAWKILKDSTSRIDIRVPILIDQSQAGAEFSDRFFIVIEKAPGFDLSELARVARFGTSNELTSDEDNLFLKTVAALGRLPDAILLRILMGMFQLFEKIHTYSRPPLSEEASGVIWNDVKPEHIFWDPQSAVITVIDWGNVQFLMGDGYTKDRRYSRNDDYKQFIQSFGHFISEVNPQLYEQLSWPESLQASLSFADRLTPVKHKIANLLAAQQETLNATRQAENRLINSTEPDLKVFQELLNDQQIILTMGEIPDYYSAERFYIQLATRFIREARFSEFIALSEIAQSIQSRNPLKWQLLTEIARYAENQNIPDLHLIIDSLTAGFVDDWDSAFWNLYTCKTHSPTPTWWDEITDKFRQIGLGVEPDSPRPVVMVKRNLLMMQATLTNKRDKSLHQPEAPTPEEKLLTDFESIINLLRDEVLPKWTEIEPYPPDSGLPYSDLVRLTTQIGKIAPEISVDLDQAIDGCRNQVNLILEAWNSQDFDHARQGLRRLLLFDPDRPRVLTADQAIARAPKRLQKIRQGPGEGQPLLEFITEAELSLRELRSQLGPADWLDRLLEGMRQIRKGRKPLELLVEQPDLRAILPWIDTAEMRRYVPSQPARPIPLERRMGLQTLQATVQNVHDGALGQGEDILLAEPLDTWAPEARGSSARAFTGFLRDMNTQWRQAAIKIMRHDRVEYALPLYREEINVLNIMRDVPGVLPLIEMGFIYFDDGMQLPPDNRPFDGRGLTGKVIRFNPEQAGNYLSALENRAHSGWLPYLAIQKLDNQENLMWSCDLGYTHGKFLPIEESIRLALQICDLLKVAHDRNIIYRDHKLLHYYWLELYNGVFIIDWNVARYKSEGLSAADIQFDLVQLGARALHHIITGRVAPGAIADGPNRVEEIEAAANHYRTQWTYDDQRLPPLLKEILEQLLSASYRGAAQLREDIYQVYQNLVTVEDTLEPEPDPSIPA